MYYFLPCCLLCNIINITKYYVKHNTEITEFSDYHNFYYFYFGINYANMILLQTLSDPLRDGAQAYTETNPDRLIVEPFNFATSALFIVIAIYWFMKIRRVLPHHRFLCFMLIMLLTGGIGGTVYHGFRWHRIFLMMDWMPILIITISASVYFFIKVSGRWWLPVALVAVCFLFQAWLFNSNISIQTAININYAMMAAIVLLPVFIFLYKTDFRNVHLVAGAILSFGIALFFRWFDKFSPIDTGTHFLWHIFGLLAVHLMISYLYRSEIIEKK
jgi:hypothetical protein